MAGRPKGEKSFAAMLRIAINEATEDGRTALRDVAQALVDKAKAGDVQAIKEVADRLDGKVPQGIIGGGDDDPPVNIGGSAIDLIASRIAGIASRTGSPEDNK